MSTTKCLGYAECAIACFCGDQPECDAPRCERCHDDIEGSPVEHEGLDWHMNCLVLELAECAKQWSCSTWFPGHDFVTVVAS
jgi:hypothetical protein